MFGRKRPVSDFNAEIEAHLQLEIERLKGQGLSEQEARAAARRALAIGANTAIFSVVDAVLLRPLPFKDPGRLVWATEHFAFGPSTVISADFPAWKDRNHVLEQIAAFGGTCGANLTGAGEPSRVTITRV